MCERNVVGWGSKVWKTTHKILSIVERAYYEFDKCTVTMFKKMFLDDIVKSLEKDFPVHSLVCSATEPTCLCVFLLHLVPPLV